MVRAVSKQRVGGEEKWIGCFVFYIGSISLGWGKYTIEYRPEVVQVANYTSWIKISSLENHETEDEALVEDIQIID